MVDRFHETKQLICIFDRVEDGHAVFHGYKAILKANREQVLNPVFNRMAYASTLSMHVPEYRLTEEELHSVTEWEIYRNSPAYSYKPDMGVMLAEDKKKGLAELVRAKQALKDLNGSKTAHVDTIMVPPVPVQRVA